MVQHVNRYVNLWLGIGISWIGYVLLTKANGVLRCWQDRHAVRQAIVFIMHSMQWTALTWFNRTMLKKMDESGEVCPFFHGYRLSYTSVCTLLSIRTSGGRLTFDIEREKKKRNSVDAIPILHPSSICIPHTVIMYSNSRKGRRTSVKLQQRRLQSTAIDLLLLLLLLLLCSEDLSESLCCGMR